MDRAPETRYARSGKHRIAYQVVGHGPLDLVLVHGWISHVEHLWDEPGLARVFERLASFSRLIMFDKRGTGSSDPVPLNQLPTLEERMDDVRAVLDAVGSQRAALLGTSEGGALSILFAATHPERTTALILLNAYARLAFGPDYPWGIGEDAALDLLQAIDEGWGQGVAFDTLVASQIGNEAMRTWWARYQRLAASPGAAVTLLRSAMDTDVRAVLPSIRVPTLVLHRVGDPFVPADHGRYLAAHVEGARYVELVGRDHLFFSEDSERLLAEVQGFLTGAREGGAAERVLATVLFIDLVESTALAVRLGDRRWRDTIDGYYAAVRRELARFRGRALETSGGGLFATFDGPARAIRCACAIRETVWPFGVEVRAGVHTGECEMIGGTLGGVALNIGARVSAEAQANEVLVSSAVKDLVAGSGIRFEDRGGHTLKDVPGEWRLFRIARSRVE